MKKFTRSVAFKIIICLVAIVAIYAGIMYASIGNVRTHLTNVKDQYNTLMTNMDEGNYQESMNILHQISADIKSVETEMSGWQWNVAGVLPVYGDDARCAQGLATISDNLASKALIPVAEAGNEIVELVNGSTQGSSTSSSTGSANDWENVRFEELLTEKGLTKLAQFATALADAQDVVTQSRKETEALPEPHIKELKEARDKVYDSLTEIEDMLDKIGGFLELFKSNK